MVHMEASSAQIPTHRLDDANHHHYRYWDDRVALPATVPIMSIRKLGQWWAVYSGEQPVTISENFPYWAVS